MRPLLGGHIPGPVSYPLGRAFPTSVTHPNESFGTVQSTQGSMFSLTRPPVESNAHSPTDPMLTHIRKMENARNLGYYLALRDMWRLKEETDWVRSVPINVSLKPLFLSMSGEWMTESKAKKVFRAAVTRALLIRDGVIPSPQVVENFTLYSNKVGKKVHMDFVPTIDGTLTRQLGGWAPAAGDAPY